MEIDIPDLDDVSFVIPCWCSNGYQPTDKDCPSCGGSGTRLSPVGKRLLEFLDACGVRVDPEGWRKIAC